jgi:hypothetical protein
VLAAVLVRWLKLPPESQEIVDKGLSLNDLDVESHQIVENTRPAHSPGA